MTYQFPPTTFSLNNSLSEQITHINEECAELLEADLLETHHRTLEEMFDLYHSVETGLRIFERIYGPLHVHKMRDAVEKKNRSRGYYVRGLTGAGRSEMTVCAKHNQQPAWGYSECPGCEVEHQRTQITALKMERNRYRTALELIRKALDRKTLSHKIGQHPCFILADAALRGGEEK